MFTHYTPQMFHQTALNLFQQGQLETAISYLKQGITTYPNVVELWQLSTAIFAMSGQLEQAEAAAYQVIRLQPSPQAYYDLGLVFQHQKNWDKAETAYRHAINLNPSFAQAYNNLGLVLHEQQRFNEAITAYQQSIHYDPQYARAYSNLGITLEKLEQLDQAIEMYQVAIKYQSTLAEAYHNLADALRKKQQYQQALDACQQALHLKPTAETYYTLAMIFSDINDIEQTILALRYALQLNPKSKKAKGYFIYSLQKVCAWDEWQLLIQTILTTQEYEDIPPFTLLSISDDPRLQQRCARQFAASQFSRQQRALFTPRNHKKLKIGYLSADFKEHPVSYLMAEVFELHNRERFEIIGYSIGQNDHSKIRQRIKNGFDQFHDVQSLSLKETASYIAKNEIDILVDLTGYTAHSRTAVLGFRPAPVQVHFLGFAGTLGTPYVDYIIADKTIIPEQSVHFYDEQVVWMPDTYWVMDRQLKIGQIPSKKQAGLPEDKFIFCCFNASYKILPNIFQIWMNLLKVIPNSILWLSEANSLAVENLRREAGQYIDLQRLVFAPRQQLLEDHLARLSLADLMLDTLPYNAHTTMSDALWVGVPAITCMGESFASRVGASLLKAVGLPELITTNLQDYEKLALELATHPTKLAFFKKRLKENQNTCVLFDTPRWVKNLETGYEMMWERFQQGLPPEPLEISYS